MLLRGWLHNVEKVVSNCKIGQIGWNVGQKSGDVR